MSNMNNLAVLRAMLLVCACCLGWAGTGTAGVRFEHLAINVDNPEQVADWYVKYLGLQVVSKSKKMIFVADPDRHFMFEFYRKAEAKGHYSDTNHAASHVAFAVNDAPAVAGRMLAGGAKILKAFTNPAGDKVINMVDPWGNHLQIIQRAKSRL
jgi:catechol 2,3-dioxygenase-like lactoylglutathione lyase family enzyme